MTKLKVLVLSFSLLYGLVWTPCLMHRCVYLMVHITKLQLQLQITFSKPLYIPHFACIHWDPGRWKSWCLHCLWLMHEIATYSWPWEKIGDSFCCCTWIYILRFSFPRRRRLLQQEDGESHNTFSWTGWMMGWMDGKSFTTMTSFTICNNSNTLGCTPC